MTGVGSNLPEIRSKLLAQDSQFAVISFDVFDTLIQRTLPHPDTTKIPAAKAILALFHTHPPTVQLDQIINQRSEIETTLRQQAKSRGEDPECHIEEVFSHWLSSIGLQPTQETIDELIEVELQAELAVSYATPGMLKLIEELEKQHFRMIFASDMYYSQSLIYRILEHCGYVNCFRQGYVSSELGVAKYSGKLFQYILTAECLKHTELIHIGDKLEADVQGAAKCGIAALQFRDRLVESMHTTQSYLLRLREKSHFWEGASWQAWSIASQAHKQRADFDPLYRISYEYLGALLTNFIHRVLNLSIKQKPDVLLFCAREGFLLSKLYALVVESLKLDDAPKGIYAFLNRKSVYTASLHEIGPRELDMGFHTTSPSLRNMLVRFSLPVEEVLTLAKSTGFENPDAFIEDPLRSSDLKRLLDLAEFKSLVEKSRKLSDNSLARYLESLGFWKSSKIALVDVGWNGTVQEALTVAFRNRPDCPEILGYYMAFLGNKKFAPASQNRYEGIFHDYRENDPAVAFNRYVELFETACRAPHPTVTGFIENPEGEVIPVFENGDTVDYTQERSDEKWIATVQSGILDYCEDYLKTIPFRRSPPELESAYILSRIERLLHFPTREEAELLTRFGHSEGFGQSLVYVPEQRDKTGGKSVKQRVDNQRTLWPEAEVVKKRIPGLNLLFNAARVIKTRHY